MPDWIWEIIGPPAQKRGFVFVTSSLSSALVVRHGYHHALARGVATAVGAGDSNCIDAAISVTFPLGSKLHVMLI